MIVRLIIRPQVAVPALSGRGGCARLWPGAWAYLILMIVLSFTLEINLAWHDLRVASGANQLPPTARSAGRRQGAVDHAPPLRLPPLAGRLMGLNPKALFAWSSVPALVQVLGALITLWSIWFCYRTMLENSFAAPVVKLQRERGQRVISTGPYAFVRHPMYFGAAFYFIGVALLLGSYGGASYSLLC